MIRKSLPLIVLLAALVAPGAAGAAGVGINVTGFGNPAQVQQLGATSARAFLVYPADNPAQPSQQTIDSWTQFVRSYVAVGARPEIVITGDNTGGGRPPASNAAFASYVGALAQALGPKVAAWEIWNEEDEALWWGKAGDAAGYASLLKAVYPRVHPYAPVFVGGLTGNNYLFLENLYKALGGSSANAFDGVATHTDVACATREPGYFYRNPDGRISQYAFLGLREVHATMAAHGDADKPLWISELGWDTYGGLCDSGAWAGKSAAGVSEADQAKFLGMAWHCLKDYPYVQNALWFNVQDGAVDSSLYRYGLLRADGSAKPAWQAFMETAAGADPYAGQPCGDFDGPSITISQPTDGAQYSTTLPIGVSANDPSGVGRISLSIDGKKIRNFTTGITDMTQFPKSLGTGDYVWHGSAGDDAAHLEQVGLGPHTLTVTAIDGNGNASNQDVHVVRVDPSKMTGVVPQFRTFKLRGKGSHRAVRVVVTGATDLAPFRYYHKVRVLFQRKAGGRWRTYSRFIKSARDGRFAFTARPSHLKHGRWRVRGVFLKKAPFVGVRTKYLFFKV